MQFRRYPNGQLIETTGSPLGSGGEGSVYAIRQDAALVAKIYHKPTDTYARKLAVMRAKPPDDPTAAEGHVSIAWPVDLLRTADDSQRIVGFLMPRVTGASLLIDFYNPGTRRQRRPWFDYLRLHHTARNLATAVHALHTRGYVIADVKEANTLVADSALVTLVDTDSFQVRDPSNGVVYRCPVGTAEFTPSELQGRNFTDIDRTPEHDLFGLAVLIFQLLMEGTHPFAGGFLGDGDPPPYEARIAAGHFPYGTRRVLYRPPRTAPPFAILHPALRQLFLRCFEAGHNNPQVRPDARTWQITLSEAENALITCSVNTQHRYGNHLNSCPWCERTAQLGGHDPFPSQQAIQSGQHLRPVPSRSTSLPRPRLSMPPPQPTPTTTPATTPTRIRNRRAWATLMLVLVVFLYSYRVGLLTLTPTVRKEEQRPVSLALDIAKTIEAPQERAGVLNAITIAQAKAGDRAAAQQTIAQALKAANAIADSRARADTLRDIAIAQVQAGDPEAAHRAFAQALEAANAIGNSSARADVLVAIVTALASNSIILADKDAPLQASHEVK